MIRNRKKRRWVKPVVTVAIVSALAWFIVAVYLLWMREERANKQPPSRRNWQNSADGSSTAENGFRLNYLSLEDSDSEDWLGEHSAYH